MTRTRSWKLALLALPLIALGCSDSEDAPTDPGAGSDDAIVLDHAEPLPLLEAFERAWSERNYNALAALLHEDFEFKPVVDDEFPWIPEQGWTRSIELDIAAHMFNPGFVSEDTGESVDTILLELTVLNQREVIVDGQTRFEITTEMVCTVLWAEGDGANSDVLLIFQLVLDENDFYRIICIEELDLVLRPASSSVDASTWGSVKNMYR